IKAQRSESGGQNSVQSPPPYEGGGQLPLLQGKLGVRGEVDVCGDVEITDVARRQQGKDEKKSLDKGIRLDCYKEVKAELRRLNEQGIELPDLEVMDENESRYCGGAFGQSTNKSDLGRQSLRLDNARMVTVDEWSDEEQGKKSRYKSTSTPKFHCPIVVKGAQFNYVPLTSMDLGGLVARLPDLSEGAGKWIKLLEDEVQGKMISLGDIKALLARVVGGLKMTEILYAAELSDAVDSHALDGTLFDPYRPAVWHALRSEYPARVDPNALKGDQLGEKENPAVYVQRQLKRWRETTETNPESDPLLATLFRQAIINAMPTTIKAKLEDVVGLCTKSHSEFCDHVIHAVDQHRNSEARLKLHEQDVNRKLAQLQLDDLTRRKKLQATIKTDAADQMSVTAAASNPAAVPGGLPAMPDQRQQLPLAVRAFEQTSPRWGVKPPPRYYNTWGPRAPGGCWRCGDPGHLKQDCPMNQWDRSYRGGMGPRGRPTQARGQGLMNPWAGPKHGY
ncbi:MAG: C2HC-type zinc finger protein, partial [Brevinema sp.]